MLISESRHNRTHDGGSGFRLRASRNLACARGYPTAFPAQQLGKPGAEMELACAPMYEAPHYKGSEKLLDRVELVTGGDPGIGRAIAVLQLHHG